MAHHRLRATNFVVSHARRGRVVTDGVVIAQYKACPPLPEMRAALRHATASARLEDVATVDRLRHVVVKEAMKPIRKFAEKGVGHAKK